jgi:3-oxoadipate enol-lactonase
MTARPDDSRLPPGTFVDVPLRSEMFVREVQGPPGAPAVLLLHGCTSTSEITWYGVFGRLGEHFRVVAPDLRGHGLGPRDGRTASIGDVVTDLAALIRALELGPVVVVGYSLGGAVAQRLAHECDDIVAGAVLCASASRFTAEPIPLRWVWTTDVVCKLAAVLPDAVSSVVAEAIMRLVYGSNEFQSWALPLMRRHRWSNVLYLAADLTSFDSSRWVGDIRAPVAVLTTTDDVYVPVERQAELAVACGARVFEMPGGHSACLSDPDRFASILLEACEHVLESPRRRGDRLPAGTAPQATARAEPA